MLGPEARMHEEAHGAGPSVSPAAGRGRGNREASRGSAPRRARRDPCALEPGPAPRGVRPPACDGGRQSGRLAATVVANNLVCDAISRFTNKPSASGKLSFPST